MKFNRKLSIIVPNYNNEKYIDECVESILNQTFSDYEIIIADDRSNDNSREIIEKYVNNYPNRIKAIFNKQNLGVTQNRHNAILSSTGYYITTLDSDDYYFYQKKLESEIILVEEYKRKHLTDIIAYSNLVFVNEQKEPINRRGLSTVKRQGNIFKYVMSYMIDNPVYSIMLREVYENVGGYNTALRLYEDWDLNIRLSSKYSFFHTGEDGTAYRRHGTGLSSVHYMQHIFRLVKIFRANCGLIPSEMKPFIYFNFTKRMIRLLLSGILRKNPKLYESAKKLTLLHLKS